MRIPDEIIKSCQQQNTKAQKQLYKMLLPYLRAVANRYLKDTSYTKDVLQESFIKIFKQIKSYDPNKAPIKSWATRIVINTSINYNQRIIQSLNETYDVTKHEIVCFPKVIKDLSTEHLLFILKQMPTDYFEVFNLFVVDGYSHDEIAKTKGISIELSRKRLSRAKEWLKKTFRDEDQMKSNFSAIPRKLK